MFYLSYKHHFDIMFVILCVIARATSHNVSNTSKTPLHQPSNHSRASFIEFILDASLPEHLQQFNSINLDLTSQFAHDHESTTRNQTRKFNLCALMSFFLNSFQMKFCLRHQDVLEAIIPQVMQLTRKECTRITTDLRWKCSSLDLFLDRSHPLALTREAAIIRSILNASMMYLVVKICTDTRHRSCGCLANHQQYSSTPYLESSSEALKSDHQLNSISINERNLSPTELRLLDSGSPLHLSKSIIQRQGCLANVAFANTFAKVFIDTEHQRSLNKASKILSDYQSTVAGSSRIERRVMESEQRELAYIRWTRSAIILHNNNVGRQMLRETMRRQCRCHGVSGVCQFQTCWDKLPDFDVVTSRLRSIYLTGSSRVDVKNSGTYEKPDLYLVHETKSGTKHFLDSSKPAFVVHQIKNTPIDSTLSFDEPGSIAKVHPKELLYLYSSPDYCEAQPNINHRGTTRRECALTNNITMKASKKMNGMAGMAEESELTDFNQEGSDGIPGSCQLLCCNRGYSSELVFEMVTCNCRFRFCCRVECDHCLQQRVQHYCL